MNKDDILIVKYPFRMTPNRIDILHKRLLDMKKTGIILLPDYCEIVIAPKDAEIKVEMENNEPSSPWVFVENPNYSPFDSGSKEYNLLCDGCSKIIDKWDIIVKRDDGYIICPYCGKKHTFGAEE